MKISIGKAASELGVSRDTLRRWEKSGKIVAERTKNGHRRYNLAQLLGASPRKDISQKKTIAYARVSSHDQKEDLIRQIQVLESFCAAGGWTYEVIEDLGSGLNQIIQIHNLTSSYFGPFYTVRLFSQDKK